MKNIKMLFVSLFALHLVLSSHSAQAADGKTIVERNRCASCHNMNGPAAKTIAEVMNRKAPDLFYAGSKFQEKFLVEFLQRPYRIRPAGPVFLNYVKGDDDIDKIQEPPLCASKLSKEDAAEAAKYLLTLKEPGMNTGVYNAGSGFSKVNARIVFFKSTACNACHQVDTGDGTIKGGVSGPVLYNAGARLNGDWVFSYLKDPQHWDPKVWMPKRNLPDNTWLLLTNYVMSMQKPSAVQEVSNK